MELSSPGYPRLRGFRDSLGERGVALPEENIYEGNFKFDSGISAVRNFQDHGIEYTTIWALNDIMAFGVLKELHGIAREVPGEVSVLGMDALEFGDNHYQRILLWFGLVYRLRNLPAYVPLRVRRGDSKWMKGSLFER